MEILVGVVVAVVLIAAVAWRLRYSLGLAEAGSRESLSQGGRVTVVVAVLVAIVVGLWFGLN